MRVFLAVDLHDTLGEAAHGWGREVARALGPRDAAGLSWVAAPRIHLTLHFFGELDPGSVATLRDALGDVVPQPSFDVVLGGGGTFPATGPPRVLWLGLDAGAEALTRLHAWIAPRVSGIGQPDRHGAFSPHVTIARVRRGAGRGLGRSLREAAAQVPAPAGTARVDRITLMESALSPSGPTYRPVAELPLSPR